jgi:hypothetical protein
MVGAIPRTWAIRTDNDTRRGTARGLPKRSAWQAELSNITCNRPRSLGEKQKKLGTTSGRPQPEHSSQRSSRAPSAGCHRASHLIIIERLSHARDAALVFNYLRRLQAMARASAPMPARTKVPGSGTTPETIVPVAKFRYAFGSTPWDPPSKL